MNETISFMAECITVDPEELIRRATRLRSLGARIEPMAGDADRLADELAAVGSPAYGALGSDFSTSWQLAMQVFAGRLESVGDRLDAAAITYAAYEELLAEAFE